MGYSGLAKQRAVTLQFGQPQRLRGDQRIEISTHHGGAGGGQARGFLRLDNLTPGVHSPLFEQVQRDLRHSRCFHAGHAPMVDWAFPQQTWTAFDRMLDHSRVRSERGCNPLIG